MYQENPGIGLFHKDVYIISTGNSVLTMNDAITKMVNLAVKLATKQTIGKPLEEGYIPRGFIINEISGRTGAERVVGMLLDKLAGKPIFSEVTQPKFDRTELAAPLDDLELRYRRAGDGWRPGSQGNPDRRVGGATKYGKYSLKGIDILKVVDFGRQPRRL
jgi:glycine reductase